MFDADAVMRGERSAVARALNTVEGRFERTLLDPLWVATRNEADGGPPGGLTVGLTGPPGVGKSTLAGRLIRLWRAQGLTVGVLCIDPSSRTSGGALLGDRLRMQLNTPDDGVFIRSLAARNSLGGLAPAAWDATLVMQAAFDRVLVETVGVGQSETDIARLADLTVVVVQPASGDVLQFLKAGLMEVFDILVVNKADLGHVADKAVADLRTALRVQGRRETSVLAVSAATDRGLPAFVAAIEASGATEPAALRERRARHYREHALERAVAWYGLRAVTRLGGLVNLAARVAAVPDTVTPSAFETLLNQWFDAP